MEAHKVSLRLENPRSIRGTLKTETQPWNNTKKLEKLLTCTRVKRFRVFQRKPGGNSTWGPEPDSSPKSIVCSQNCRAYAGPLKYSARVLLGFEGPVHGNLGDLGDRALQRPLVWEHLQLLTLPLETQGKGPRDLANRFPNAQGSSSCLFFTCHLIHA